MKKIMITGAIIYCFTTFISCNKSNDSTNLKKETEVASKRLKETNPDLIFGSNYKPDLYETSEVLLDTIFKKGDTDIRMKVRMREDLASRNITETSSCNKDGLLVTYGNEFILEFFQGKNVKGNDFLIGRNYVNIDLIRRMDYVGRIEKQENLYSFEGITSLESNQINLKFGTIYAVGEGSNDIELGFDLSNDVDICNIGGVLSMRITNPYD